MSENSSETPLASRGTPPNASAAEDRGPTAPAPSGLSTAEQTLQQILKLYNRLTTPFSVYLERRYKISLNEFRLLMLIGRFGPAASHELVEMSGVNAMSVSRAVTTLEKNGRISVVRDPANRRRKTLSLTEEGHRLFGIMQPQTDRVADYLLSELHADEVMALNRYLATLIGTLEASDADGQSVFLERTRPVENLPVELSKAARPARPAKRRKGGPGVADVTIAGRPGMKSRAEQ